MMAMLLIKMLVVAATDDGDYYKYNHAVKTHSYCNQDGIESTYNICLVCGKVLMFLVWLEQSHFPGMTIDRGESNYGRKKLTHLVVFVLLPIWGELGMGAAVVVYLSDVVYTVHQVPVRQILFELR